MVSSGDMVALLWTFEGGLTLLYSTGEGRGLQGKRDLAKGSHAEPGVGLTSQARQVPEPVSSLLLNSLGVLSALHIDWLTLGWCFDLSPPGNSMIK